MLRINSGVYAGITIAMLPIKFCANSIVKLYRVSRNGSMGIGTSIKYVVSDSCLSCDGKTPACLAKALSKVMFDIVVSKV